MPFLDWVYLDNSVRAWLIAAAVALFVYVGTDVLRRLLIRQITALSARTDNYADDLIADTLRRTKTYFLLFVSLYAASRVLYLSDSLGTALRFVGVIVVVAQAAPGHVGVPDMVLERVGTIQDGGDPPLCPTGSPVEEFLLRDQGDLAVGGQAQGRSHSSQPGADDQEVVCHLEWVLVGIRGVKNPTGSGTICRSSRLSTVLPKCAPKE